VAFAPLSSTDVKATNSFEAYLAYIGLSPNPDKVSLTVLVP
jgi:hypothetical protein